MIRISVVFLCMLLFSSSFFNFAFNINGAELLGKTPPPPSLPSASEEDIEKLISDLYDEEFQVREAATRDLINSGFDSTGMLFKLLEDKDEEIRTRGIRCLQHIFTKALLLQMDDEVDKLETLVNTVSTSKYPKVREFAREMTANYQGSVWMNLDLFDLDNIWERYAYRRIINDGGKVITTMSSRGINHNEPDGGTGEIDIIIGKEWHGNDHSLRMLSRFIGLNKVFLLKGNNLNANQLTSLKESLPEDTVQLRSNARLGVMGNSTLPGQPCEISMVVDGSAADRAGIKTHDLIIGYQGKPISEFSSLIETIKESEPGDKVKIKILREGQPYELDVVLDPWVDDSINAQKQRKQEWNEKIKKK